MTMTSSRTRTGSNELTKLGFCFLLTLSLIVLVNTSIGIQRTLTVDQGPCDVSTQTPASLDKLATANKALLEQVREETSKAIHSKDQTIAELERQVLGKEAVEGHGPNDVRHQALSTAVLDRAQDGIRPLRVIVTHYPRPDRLGAFALSSIFLLAICYRWGWEMETLPYHGSTGLSRLQRSFDKLGNKGLYRKDYNPTELNSQVYTNLGFFPKQHFAPANINEWTEISRLPAPGTPALQKVCLKNPIREEANGHATCRLILSSQDATGPLQKHMLANSNDGNSLDDFFTPALRQIMRDRFMEANVHRLKHFSVNDSNYNVVIHVRRGDVTRQSYPDRWTDQSAYASIARHICQSRQQAIGQTTNIHIFSDGDNHEEGGWKTLEQLTDTCSGEVLFHLYENEFDVWAHFVSADAFVTSRSTFSYVPALISGGDIYAPEWGHPPLIIGMCLRMKMASW